MNAVLLYEIINIYFFIMIISIVFWAANVTSLNNSGYTRITTVLGFAICIYIFGYAMELSSDTQGEILFWNRFEYLGIPYISALWLTVALLYTGLYSRHKPVLYLLIYGIPVITMMLRMTNDLHHLYFSESYVTIQNGKMMFVRMYGPWMYVQSIHSMAMILISLGLFFRESIQNKEQAHGKTRLIFSASVVAIAGLVLSYLKPGGYVLDYMAVFLPATCLLVILAIARYDFLEIRLLAHSKSFESNKDALLLINRQGRIIDENQQARQLFAQVGVTLSHSYVGRVFQKAPELGEMLMRNENSVLQLTLGDKTHYFELDTTQAGQSGHLQVNIKTISDVTQAYEMNQTLQRQALRDELSGLYNRRAFISLGGERLRSAGKQHEQVHLLMLDLDYFKGINDRYGHQAGDRMIQTIGQSLLDGFPEQSLIARVGGEEFAVLLTGQTDQTIDRDARQFVRKIAAQTHTERGQAFHITVSIGVATEHTPQNDLYALMLQADKALYQAKKDGRNCLRWSRGLAETSARASTQTKGWEGADDSRPDSGPRESAIPLNSVFGEIDEPTSHSGGQEP